MNFGSSAVNLDRYRTVRAHTDSLTKDLTPEDQSVQSMLDASPVKWHRAHTTWFFERFMLREFYPEYRVFDPNYDCLFNSYYESVGPRQQRQWRGLLTRPSAERISEYRDHVDGAIAHLLGKLSNQAAGLVELGLQHEQQHQELLVTDILHAFSQNPLTPAMRSDWTEPLGAPGPTKMVICPGSIVEIGHVGSDFCFDNETPRHQVALRPFEMASRLVRNGEWLDFIADGGYREPIHWMSDGWEKVQADGWSAPLHWRHSENGWQQMSPGGLIPLNLDAPVRHISWYEADAYSRWASARLPTEAEWESASGRSELFELTGHVWQWTASAYSPYPGFRPLRGAIGEYNGKFMINQMVLRGGSMVTPPDHARSTYRNFFHPDKRWQFSGVRLAKDA